MQIRPARYADIPAITALAAEALARSRFSSFAHLDEAGVKRAALQAITDQKTGNTAFLLAEDAGKVVGCFLGNLSPLYLTDVTVAANTFFYVAEGARATVALRLLRAFMRWAGKIDSPLIYRIGVSDATDALDRQCRMMEAAGFRLYGANFEKEKF